MADPQASDDVAGGLFKRGQETVSPVDRDDAVNVVIKRTGKSRAEAASKAAIFGFLGLLISVAALGYGAKMGTDSKDDYNRYDRPVCEVR